MKNRFVKIGLSIVLVSGVVTSCNRLLDANDPNNITEGKALSSLSGLEKINRGFYPVLPTVQYIPTLSQITDELVINVEDNLGGGVQYYTWEYAPGTSIDNQVTSVIFQNFYNSIRRTNLTIANIDNISATTADEISKKNLLKAEALGMRAYLHYQILQIFSPKYDANALGCAYVTSLDERALPSRDNMRDSYQKVLQDLDAALAIFPSTDNNNTRMNKSAIEALKAKVYLEIGEYANAVTYATTVLGKYELTTAANYPNVWADTNDYKEVIFKQANVASSGGSVGAEFVNSLKSVQFNASSTLYTKYESTDVRKSLFQENFTVGTRNKGTISLKYLKPGIDNVKPWGRADVKLIRTAEILLVRAEAYARQGNLSAAFTDYKKLRDARNAGVSSSFVSQSAALDAIFDERSRELAYEGFRLSDIKRFGKTIVRNAADSRVNYTTLSLTDVYKYTLPIPQVERFANPNLQQNSGY